MPRRVALPRTFYRIDSTRVSVREYWWGTRSPLILIALLLKGLRVRIPSSTDDPNVESLAPFEVDADAIPSDVRERMAPAAQALEAGGFRSPIYHLVADDLHHARTTLATFAHESGVAWARIHERLWSVHTPAKQVLFVEIVTPFDGGTFLWSLSSKADLAAPPSCTVIRRQGAAPDELWSAHQEALRDRSSRRVVAVDDVRPAIEAHHRAVRNFHLRREVFAPLTAADRRTLAANERGRTAAQASGARFPEVMAEIRRLQDKKSSWATGVLVLLVSLAFFLGTSGSAGFATGAGGGFSLEALVILVGVVAFHETGHFLAMKLFDYRNVQMFFIPFLGAAVSGRHYNVPGWKKAVVSLMGPLPGVLLGAVLGAIGLMTSNGLLLRIAMTALILNGLNLLPVLPLDGGWVVQALVASRHAFIEVAFRVLAAAALLGASVWSGDRILMVLGTVMALSIPVTYRTARVTGELRRARLEPLSADDQTIPSATADAIVDRLVASMPKRPTRQLAQMALQVFESLNSRPPGIAASLGLAFVQAAGLGAAIVFAVLVAVGQQTSLSALLSGLQPAHELDPASVVVRRPLSAFGAAGTPHNTVVATFTDPAAAAAAAADLEQRSPGAVATFGQTALLALPAADDAGRKQWRAHLQAKAADVFVATPQAPARLDMACLASTAAAAAAIERDASDYLVAGPLHLMPPWTDPDSRTAAEQTQHARARRTNALLHSSWMEVQVDPALLPLQQASSAALRAGDTAERERLRGEMKRVTEELRRAQAEKLRADPALDAAFLERYLALETHPTDPSVAASVPRSRMAELAPLLGQLKMADGAPDPAHDAVSATGVVSREGLLLRMPFLSFRSSFEGPVAFVRWLARQGCTDIRYEFGMGGAPGTGEDEEVD